ncbi:hypothetical protein L2737_16630 [Shewanella electrodiphila]|uniref:Uncharacterized protein n=1 Tax=Shewanella electrodiphila TaxID=934143 RepID=A0ABT0KU91_9GAMM|nr:hypothetical protein [Shewanella electrodiphila]MCL1046925.1 hypothetical protein [Shewanella electrodiphila]
MSESFHLDVVLEQMPAGVVKALKKTDRNPGEDVKDSTINLSVYSYALLKKVKSTQWEAAHFYSCSSWNKHRWASLNEII